MTRDAGVGCQAPVNKKLRGCCPVNFDQFAAALLSSTLLIVAPRQGPDRLARSCSVAKLRVPDDRDVMHINDL